MRNSGDSTQGFNPRPRTGGDVEKVNNAQKNTKFQSTPPHGGRRNHLYDTILQCNVSIHAPARGATEFSRPHERLVLFQSTPPHGGRRHTIWKEPLWVSFNPRPRTGGDMTAEAEDLRRAMFQSTPPHGGRHYGRDYGDPNTPVSIHAPARGATGGHSKGGGIVEVSIHAPARGATCTA